MCGSLTHSELMRLNIVINLQISFHSSNRSYGYLLNTGNRAVKKMDRNTRPHGFIFVYFDWKQQSRAWGQKEGRWWRG